MMKKLSLVVASYFFLLLFSQQLQCFCSAAAAATGASHFALNVGLGVDRWARRGGSSNGNDNALTARRRRAWVNPDDVWIDELRRVSSCASSSSRSPGVAPESSRGGADFVASIAAKTMSKRQMEAFKLLSGGVAGTVAAVLTNPLEVIKTRLQSSSVAAGDLVDGRGHPAAIAKRIMQEDGVRGFFRGLPPTLVGIIPSRSAYFYAYQKAKHALGPYFAEGSPPNALVAGFLAGIAGNTLTNPIWMIRTRMQLHVDTSAGQRAYSGYADAISTIFREEGIAGFYKGIFASYWGCAEGSIQFILYEQFKTRLLRRRNRQRAAKGRRPTEHLSELSLFMSAAAAKMIASIATYPHEVARTRLREQARSGVFKYSGMWQTLSVIAKEEGRQGLYAGLGVHLMKVVPNSAFMFLTYEIVRKWLGEFEVVDEEILE